MTLLKRLLTLSVFCKVLNELFLSRRFIIKPSLVCFFVTLESPICKYPLILSRFEKNIV